MGNAVMKKCVDVLWYWYSDWTTKYADKLEYL